MLSKEERTDTERGTDPNTGPRQEVEDAFPGGDDALKKFRGGDRTVLAGLYQKFAPGVARFLKAGFSFRSGEQLMRFAGITSPAELEVGLQEVFSRAFSYRARRAYDGARSFEAYVIGIAKNYCIDLTRAQASEKRRNEALQGVHEEAAEPAQDLAVQERELARLLEAFIAGLLPNERAVFNGCLREGKTQAEVAASLGSNRLRVWRVVERLKRQLRHLLESEGYLVQAQRPRRKPGEP